MGMGAQREQSDAVGEGSSVTGAERPCPECGHPIEADGAEVGKTYTVCRSCYEVYVVNAGR
jgi:formylmethanofuran dehydrogenase subunit E